MRIEKSHECISGAFAAARVRLNKPTSAHSVRNRIIKPTHQTDVMAVIHHHATFNVELLIHFENPKEHAELT